MPIDPDKLTQFRHLRRHGASLETAAHKADLALDVSVGRPRPCRRSQHFDVTIGCLVLCRLHHRFSLGMRNVGEVHKERLLKNRFPSFR